MSCDVSFCETDPTEPVDIGCLSAPLSERSFSGAVINFDAKARRTGWPAFRHRAPAWCRQHVGESTPDAGLRLLMAFAIAMWPLSLSANQMWQGEGEYRAIIGAYRSGQVET